MNAVFEFSPKFQIRVAASRAMARPDLTNLAPSATVSVSGANRSVSVGNPLLNPFRATTYDAAAEYYYMPGALLSVALFQKNIDSFVQTVQSAGAFTDNPFNLPVSLAIAACGNQYPTTCDPAATNWTFSAPENTPGGRLRGIEINFQQPFKFLPGFLGNFGVLVNYTHVESNIKYLNSAGKVVKEGDLTGLSNNSANATLYYEDKVISARVSAAYRSGYLSDAVGTQGVDSQGTNGTLNFDASLQVTLTKQVKLTFEAINMTDEYQDQFVDSRNLQSVYHHTGREFLAGVRFNY
jgi:TonB-dependent receptor